MTVSKTRPELGKLDPGQRVIVRRSPNDMRRRPPEERYIPAVVTKAAQVWVTLEQADDGPRPKTWRMRRDTQNEGSNYSSLNASFATLEQHAWDQAAWSALAVLRDHGIELARQSPWHGREIELAELLNSVDPHDTA